MPQYFIYARKSTETEDRQVLSIESQINEMKHVAQRMGLSVLEVLTEARSAKAPGRPVFTAMMERIERREAEGIICWKLDRLARNPVDGGRVMWAIKQQGIKIFTPSQTYSHEAENAVLMYLEFGMAQKTIDDLSKNVKRGIRAKIGKGWWPGLAPVGYLNDPSKDKGDKTIIPDPERFPLVRKMWDLMLTGNYSPTQILKIANNKWGFMTKQRKRLGGTPLSRSGVYHLFTNHFYCGLFEYPRGSGDWHKGSHIPMITKEEFEHVQTLLGRKGKPRPQRKSFSFTGMIRCGECQAMITAEEKYQMICAVCRYKFAYKNKEDCPKCNTPIEKIPNPTRLHYTYYHCTKIKNPDCVQRSIEVKELEDQIKGYLSKIEIPERFKDWAIRHLRELYDNEIKERKTITQSQQKTYEDCIKRLDNLIKLKTSPQNADGSLLSDDEYARQRLELLKEKNRLEGFSSNPSQEADRCLELSSKTFIFACHARHWFTQGDNQTKREILSAVYSNLTLKDKKLSIEAKNPFLILETSLPGVMLNSAVFEPEIYRMNKGGNRDFAPCYSSWLCRKDDVRTHKKEIALVINVWEFFKGFDEYLKIPNYRKGQTYDLYYHSQTFWSGLNRNNG